MKMYVLDVKCSKYISLPKIISLISQKLRDKTNDKSCTCLPLNKARFLHKEIDFFFFFYIQKVHIHINNYDLNYHAHLSLPLNKARFLHKGIEIFWLT